ncbi:hypothetical protein EIP86_006162 [Pleurotus ostreatoroseus]|nr:hypothetical protein EIP86_006162 [Pleurotus ostreatoroseus]
MDSKATEIPLTAFIQDLLPPVHPDIHIETLCDDIERGKHRLLVAKNGHLWGYSSKFPSELKTPWKTTFKALQQCARKLAQAVEPLQPTLDFRNNPECKWELSRRSFDSLPDAYFLPQDRDPQACPDWTNIAIPGVYFDRDSREYAKENDEKITRCLSQCMNGDARRRFAYGFTIEDSWMRLWYCDRMQMIVSESFNFVHDWRTLFTFLLRVMFAEHHDLGLDPTIELLDNGSQGEAQYRVQVRSMTGEEQIYHTVRALSDTDPEASVHYRTRVWEAVRIEDGTEVGEHVVLKDTWVDSSREREGAITARLRESAPDDEKKSYLEKILLTVLAHGDVHIGPGLDLTKETSTRIVRYYSYSGTQIGQSLRKDIQKHRWAHYRIVYQEICQPLDDATSLFTVFKALGEVCQALYILHSCGWVHRDVSSGNILLYRDNVKLVDLELAEEMASVRGREHICMGNPWFMSVEAKAGEYYFLPQPPRLPPDPMDEERRALIEENIARMYRGEKPLPRPKPSPNVTLSRPRPSYPEFHYNYLHDLESLWWVAVYFVVHQDQSTDDDQYYRNQIRAAQDLFYYGSKRYGTMKLSGSFAGLVRGLHPSLQELGSWLEAARCALVNAYRSLEETLQDYEVDATVHGGLLSGLWSIAALLQAGSDLTVRPLKYTLHSF